MDYEELLKQYGEEYLEETNRADVFFYPMESLSEIALDGIDSALEIFEAGRSAYGYTTGDPNSKKTEWFNSDEYFFFDGYGNLVSLGESQVADYLSFVINKRDFVGWCEEQGYVDNPEYND